MSADFGREITTAVLWLNGFEGMDIRCVRLVPYEVDGKVLLDIQQVIPLPEATDYQVRLRKKDAARDRARRVGRDLTRYHIIVDGNELPDENKRNAFVDEIRELRGADSEISLRLAVPPDELDSEELALRLAEYQRAGVARFVFDFGWGSEREAWRRLENLRATQDRLGWAASIRE